MNPTDKFKKIFYGAYRRLRAIVYPHRIRRTALSPLGDPLVHSRVGRQLHHQLHLGIQQFEI